MMTHPVMTESTDIKHLIAAVETADSAKGLVQAVRTLSAARSPQAIPTLISVLRYNNPGAAIAAVDGLVALGEAVVQPLLERLDSYNYGARAWAVRAFAEIGDPRGLETLLLAAETDFALSVRRAAAKGLGNIDWSKLPAPEATLAQERVLSTLLKVCQDPEWVVRYAAVVGLQGLAEAIPTTAPTWLEKIAASCEQIARTDQELAVRARAQLAQNTFKKNSFQ